jgi:Protein of unknown function (DUF1573)
MKKSILAASLFLFIATANAQDSKMQSTPGTITPAAAENKNAPEIKFEIETYDFGTIKQGDKVTHDFEFLNTGKEPLIITEAHGSCGCTVPQWPKEPLAKGSKGTIHVEFNSTGKMGMQDKTVTITSNAKSGQKVLHLKGNVEAPPATPATETPGMEKK